MLLKSLLFALLLSGAAADADDEAPTLIPPPLPRLRGTAQMNSSDVSEGASPDDVIERAAVSNQFHPGPRPDERHEPFSFPPCLRRVSSDEQKPGSRFQRRASVFTTGRCPHRQDAPSRIRNLAHSAASVPPWPPNATSGLIDSPWAGGRRRVTRPMARTRRLG